MGNCPSTTPEVVIRLMLFDAVYQIFPSGPVVRKLALPGVDRVNSVMSPDGVIRPILFAVLSVNQMLPSGPAATPRGPLFAVGMGNSVTVPVGVIRPTLLVFSCTYQKLPSAPRAIPCASPEGMGNSVMTPGVGPLRWVMTASGRR